MATIDEEGDISLLAPGKTTITAASAVNTDYCQSFVLEVFQGFGFKISERERPHGPYPEKPEEDVFSVTFETSCRQLQVGQTAKVLAFDNSWSGAHYEIVFSSSDPNVASIDRNGMITALNAGVARITASSAANPDYSDSFLLTVVAEEDLIISIFNVGLSIENDEVYLVFDVASKVPMQRPFCRSTVSGDKGSTGSDQSISGSGHYAFPLGSTSKMESMGCIAGNSYPVEIYVYDADNEDETWGSVLVYCPYG